MMVAATTPVVAASKRADDDDRQRNAALDRPHEQAHGFQQDLRPGRIFPESRPKR